MKTKAFLLFCLFLVIGMTRISAQNAQNGNGNDLYEWPVPQGIVTFEIICDGILVDLLTNSEPYSLWCRDHYKNGEFYWEKCSLTAIEFTSEFTGEVFTVKSGLEKWDEAQKGFDYLHITFIGNKGHHYIMQADYDLSGGGNDCIRFKCR
jgi:hypothetical protein